VSRTLRTTIPKYSDIGSSQKQSRLRIGAEGVPLRILELPAAAIVTMAATNKSNKSPDGRGATRTTNERILIGASASCD
jgi:hypothetical protein